MSKKRRKRKLNQELVRLDKIKYNIVLFAILLIWFVNIIFAFILQAELLLKIEGILACGDSWSILFMIIPSIFLAIPFFVLSSYVQKKIPFNYGIKKIFSTPKNCIIVIILTCSILLSYFLLFFSGHIFLNSGKAVAYNAFGMYTEEYTADDIQYIEIRLYRISTGMRTGFSENLSYALHLKNGKTISFEHYELQDLLIMDQFFSDKDKVVTCSNDDIKNWIQSQNASNDLKQKLYSMFNIIEE